MKSSFENRLALVLLILGVAIAAQTLAAQSNATQTAVQAKPAYVPFHYLSSAEINVSGVVSGVQTRSVTNRVNGAHLFLAASPASIDVSLGPWAMVGPNHLSVKIGDEVSIAGVFTTINEKQVLFARSVNVGGRTYPIRNEHGVALPPQARSRGNANAQIGGAQ